MKRCNIELNGDDLLIDTEPDGEWVKYEDAAVAIAAARKERGEALEGLFDHERQGWHRELEKLRLELREANSAAETREALLKDAYELLGKATGREWGTGPGQVRRDCGHEQPAPGECPWCLIDGRPDEPLGFAALKALVVERAVAYMTERDESLPALVKLGEAVAAYRAKVTEIMGEPEPVARMHKFVSYDMGERSVGVVEPGIEGGARLYRKACKRTYPLDPLTAEDPCDDCGRDERKHEIGPREPEAPAGHVRRRDNPRPGVGFDPSKP